jgi:hypothetical protein
MILDPHVLFKQSPELERPEVHVPHPVVDLLEADVFARWDPSE